MADPPTHQTFPNDEALCERCGYPLKGLTSETACPECGCPVIESSPEWRVVLLDQSLHGLVAFWSAVLGLLVAPKQSFRRLRVDSGHDSPRAFLTRCCFFASAFFVISMSISMLVSGVPISNITIAVGLEFVFVMLVLHALTYVEMLGVTAFSKQRGWRVPFHLAKRVCCYAAVGWLPGIFVATLGLIILKHTGIGERSFSQFYGPISLSWVFYGALFILSFLWFETLVWIGVRQVRYANAWPDPPPDSPENAPPNAPEK